MIDKIKTVLSDVSLSKNTGRFLSDKSYGFDTIYFIAKFILHNAKNRLFNKGELRTKAIKYIEDLFQLTPGTAGAVNYYLETINLLTFGNIFSTDDGQEYFITNPDILYYISRQPENAFIFLYLLTYMTFKNDGILPTFEEYSKTTDLIELRNIVNKMYELFSEKSVSIGTPNSNWSKQLVKYSLIVLGFANNLNYVSRTLQVKDRKVTVKDAALNVEGSRTPLYLPKKNDYLQTFNLNYVKYNLKNELINSSVIDVSQTITEDTVANSLAELKLAMLDDSLNGLKMDDNEKQQYIDNVVRMRNQSIQTRFRKGLLEHNDHVCPICGFSFEKFLIASHIKPYAKCDDTYDAINHFNGLLMCPNHDKLFEDARYMTIDFKTGKIILSKEAEISKDFGSLAGVSIPKVYIENERRHYLEWHNNRFLEHNTN